jgi:hypothetical protein
MKFTHLSKTQITKFHTPKKLGRNTKPRALWFACGDAWKQFIIGEGMPDDWLNSYKYEYTAELDESKLIILKTAKDIKEFNDQFSGDEDFYSIDWDKAKKVTGKSGIFIKNPHIFSSRQKYMWYASFDICSVAVWKKDAIKSFVEHKI